MSDGDDWQEVHRRHGHGRPPSKSKNKREDKEKQKAIQKADRRAATSSKPKYSQAPFGALAGSSSSDSETDESALQRSVQMPALQPQANPSSPSNALKSTNSSAPPANLTKRAAKNALLSKQSSVLSASCTAEGLAQRQLDEIESLEAIYEDRFKLLDADFESEFSDDSSSSDESDAFGFGDEDDDDLEDRWDFNYIVSNPVHRFSIKIVPHEGEVQENFVHVEIEVEYDSKYPLSPPGLRIASKRGLGNKAIRELEAILTKIVKGRQKNECIYTIMDAASEHLKSKNEPEAPSAWDQMQMDHAKRENEEKAAREKELEEQKKRAEEAQQRVIQKQKEDYDMIMGYQQKIAAHMRGTASGSDEEKEKYLSHSGSDDGSTPAGWIKKISKSLINTKLRNFV